MSKELEQNENKLIAERRAKLAKIREQAIEITRTLSQIIFVEKI